VQVPIELVGLFLTPLLTAVATLFWLVVREKERRIEEKTTKIEKLEEAVESHRAQTLPALDNLQRSMVRLTDLYERQEVRKGA
jgi:hypothetical protein